MPIYKKPEDRASETVTIRLTRRDKALLDHLAGLEKKTLTDLIRSLVTKRAGELCVSDVPEKPRKRRPGRPRKKPGQQVEPLRTETPEADEPLPTGTSPEPAPAAPMLESKPPAPEQIAHQRALVSSNPLRDLLSNRAEVRGRATTFFDLIVRFHKSFAHRAEGTRKELEDTIEFLCFGGDQAIIPPDSPLAAITSERLREIRKIIQCTDLRFAKKNLHLTYLRMMLHFGVKERDIDLHINPTGELEPFSITESNEGWRFFSGR